MVVTWIAVPATVWAGLLYQVGGCMSGSLLPRAPGCCAWSAVGLRGGTAFVFPLRCRRWLCPNCSYWMAERWGARVHEAAPERMFTFTQIGSERGEINRGMRELSRMIRRMGWDWQYFGMVELTQAGAPHLHIMQRGRYIPHAWLVAHLPAIGWGHPWVSYRKGNRWAVRYCVKHMVGAHNRPFPGRRVRYSRGFFLTAFRADSRDGLEDVRFRRVRGHADSVGASLRMAGLAVEVGGDIVDAEAGDVIRRGRVVGRARDRPVRGRFAPSVRAGQTIISDVLLGGGVGYERLNVPSL